jgi:ubiquinol-cytochrome c reductase cytochrome c1 subunit
MRRFASFLFGLVVAASAHAAGGGGDLASANTQVANRAMLQRGAALYMNYCAGCHSLKYVRYSRLAQDLQLTEEQVMQNLVFSPDVKFGDTINTGMSREDGEAFFGKAPPDLSLVARSRGVDWIFSYLRSFYVDPSSPVGWNNTVYPNASMPNVLAELQGIQVAVHDTSGETQEGEAHGAAEAAHAPTLELAQAGVMTPAQFDSALRDLTSFLQYAGEPAILKRKAVGVWVLLYLTLFTFLAWLVKREYWKDVH